MRGFINGVNVVCLFLFNPIKNAKKFTDRADSRICGFCVKTAFHKEGLGVLTVIQYIKKWPGTVFATKHFHINSRFRAHKSQRCILFSDEIGSVNDPLDKDDNTYILFLVDLLLLKRHLQAETNKSRQVVKNIKFVS